MEFKVYWCKVQISQLVLHRSTWCTAFQLLRCVQVLWELQPPGLCLFIVWLQRVVVSIHQSPWSPWGSATGSDRLAAVLFFFCGVSVGSRDSVLLSLWFKFEFLFEEAHLVIKTRSGFSKFSFYYQNAELKQEVDHFSLLLETPVSFRTDLFYWSFPPLKIFYLQPHHSDLIKV